MNKIAVFGKPGGGKSTFSKKLSIATDIDLFHLDLIEYQKNGEKVDSSQYSKIHEELIHSDHWIIEGLGTLNSFWSRIEAADTIIYIDLPYRVHYWWVMKRFLKSLFVKPEGWPDGSSVLKGTIASIKILRMSPKFWTPEFYFKLQESASNKRLYRINSISELNDFVDKYAN